jgi:hypothetical protein
VCGRDVAVTFEEGDPISLAVAIRAAAAEWDFRSLEGIRRARTFTWARAVELTLAYVRAAAGEG